MSTHFQIKAPQVHQLLPLGLLKIWVSFSLRASLQIHTHPEHTTPAHTAFHVISSGGAWHAASANANFFQRGAGRCVYFPAQEWYWELGLRPAALEMNALPFRVTKHAFFLLRQSPHQRFLLQTATMGNKEGLIPDIAEVLSKTARRPELGNYSSLAVCWNRHGGVMAAPLLLSRCGGSDGPGFALKREKFVLSISRYFTINHSSKRHCILTRNIRALGCKESFLQLPLPVPCSEAPNSYKHSKLPNAKIILNSPGTFGHPAF